MFELNEYVLCSITLITGFLINFTRGLYSNKNSGDMSGIWGYTLLQSLFSLITIVIIFCCSNAISSFSWFSALLGILMGCTYIASLYTSIKACSIGPISYTTVIVSLSMVIPTLSGLFYGEKISLIQYVGIFLMIICIILSPEKEKKDNKFSFKWIMWSLAALITAGPIGILQKVHQNSNEHKEEMSTLLISCFITSVIITFICFTYQKIKNNGSLSLKNEMGYIPVLSGVATASSHSINLFLVRVLPAVVIFPLVNLVPMILLMLASVIVFKEKLSARRWIGLGIGVLSTLFLSGIIG